MRGFNAAGLAALLILASGCGKSAAPSSGTFSETFNGTVTQGAVSFGDGNRNHFTVHRPGAVTATITALSPINTISIGLGLGVFDAATSSCSLQLLADAAKINLSLSGTAEAAGELCVGVYDVGDIHETAITYVVTVVHT